MTIHTLQENHELAQEGRASLVLAGVRYTGDKSINTDTSLQSNGWPGSARFQKGQMKIGLIPDWTELDADMSVDRIENMHHFEVVYDPAELAESLLEKNYLPPNVFRQAHDRYLRERVHKKLGLEDRGVVYNRDDEEPYREQLREIAGLTEEATEDHTPQTEVEKYLQNPRDEVIAAAEMLDYPDDASVAQKKELAEYLAEWDREVALAALDGEEVDLSGDEPEVLNERSDLEEMSRPELQELYDELGGKSVDPVGDDVNLNKNDDLREGINRLR